jgi:hypothetical protein
MKRMKHYSSEVLLFIVSNLSKLETLLLSGINREIKLLKLKQHANINHYKKLIQRHWFGLFDLAT